MSARRDSQGGAAGRAALALVLAAAGPAAAGGEGPTLPPAALEAGHGLRVARVALVAAGGMVDLQLRVLDAARARALLGRHAPLQLVVDPGGAVLAAPGHASPCSAAAAGCAVLFPNAGGAVHRGGTVTLLVGDLRVGPIVVQ
ncbi:MAG: hypothetical protein QM767_30075 [Anaeromyxobacter sp.]